MKRLEELLAGYRGQPGGLIPALQSAQAIFGYLPEVALLRIAEVLDKSYSEVAGVVSFYSFFSTVPRGKHLIRVCLGTACYVKGAERIADRLQEELGIHFGETTKDKLFSLEATRCLGTCGLAPVVMIEDKVYGGVEPDQVAGIIGKYTKMAMEEKKA